MKFFRNLRKRYLSNLKIGNYLLYAIGEIILVVVGILIALQINNWNENRKLLLAEKKLYLNIIKDLDTEHQILQEHLLFSETLKSSYRKIYEYASGKSEILNLDNPVLLFQNLNFSSIVLQNHENSVDRISSDSLRSSLNAYLMLTKELSTRRAEEVEDIKVVRRPFLLENDVVDLDKILYDSTELTSININAFYKARESENFKRFITGGYASNQTLIYYTNHMINENRSLKHSLEKSPLLYNK